MKTTKESWFSEMTVKVFVYFDCKITLSSTSLKEYAQVIKMLGNGRLEAYCFDGTNRLCHIRGKLRKKVLIINLIM